MGATKPFDAESSGVFAQQRAMAKKLSSTNVAGIVSLSSQMQSGFMRNIDPRAYSSGTNIITLSGARETASPAASFSMAGKSNTLTIASWGQQGGPVARVRTGVIGDTRSRVIGYTTTTMKGSPIRAFVNRQRRLRSEIFFFYWADSRLAGSSFRTFERRENFFCTLEMAEVFYSGIMKFITIVFFFLCCGVAARAQAFTPISNLNQPTMGFYGVVGDNADLGTAFNTSSNATILSSFSLSLAGAVPNIFGDPLGPLNLYLYADAGGLPGSNLTAMVNSSNNDFPTNPGVYTYLPVSPLILQAYSRYWIVAESTTSGLRAGYSWNATPLTNLDAESTWVEGASEFNTGLGWAVQANSQFLFSVSVFSIKPPPLAIAQPITLTYTNINYPFVLQQNSDLTTTNWVTVTNATLSGVLSNQVVFIVPPGAPRLYYRLSLQ